MHTHDAADVSQDLISLCLALKHLTHLKINFDGHSTTNTNIMLVDLVQNLTMLGSLEFDLLQINDTLPNPKEFYKKNSLIKPCNIKSVRLTVSLNYDYLQEDMYRKYNCLFKFILQSCPILETFDFKAGPSGPIFGALDLDFKRQTHLNKSKSH